MDDNEQATTGAFLDDAWRRAKFCGPNGGNCVEVNLGTSGRVGVRDSKAGGGSVLAFGQVSWGTFLTATK